MPDIQYTSVNSIKKTIQNDWQVRNWFYYILYQAKPKQSPAYQPKRVLNQTILYLFNAGICLGILGYFISDNPFVLAISLILFIAKLPLHHSASAKLGGEAVEMLNTYFQEEWTKQTLFQLGESIMDFYEGPSLVESIYKEEKIIRYMIMAGFIFFQVIYPISIIKTLLSLICIFYISDYLFHLPSLYKNQSMKKY